MGFYQQFYNMAKYTHETLCKFECESFYKEYYKKHKTDFSHIQTEDITYPNNENVKKQIEEIMKHNFWKDKECAKEMIKQYRKKVGKLDPQIINNLLEIEGENLEEKYKSLAFDMYTFQLCYPTNHRLPINIFNYPCPLDKTIQHEYESYFFIKTIFNAGENRIANLIFSEDYDSKHIFNTFRQHIYNDFYNYSIKPQLENNNKKQPEKNNDDFSDGIQIGNKQDFWPTIIQAVDEQNKKNKFVSELTKGSSFFDFIKNNVSISKPLERTNTGLALKKETVIELMTRILFIFIFEDVIRETIVKNRFDCIDYLLPNCEELDFILLRGNYSPRKNYTKKEKIKLSIINPFMEQLKKNDNTTYDMFKSYLNKYLSEESELFKLLL